MKARIAWNAGANQVGRRTIDNILFGASWSRWGTWQQRHTHIYLGLWVLTIITPSKRDAERDLPI